MARSNRSHVSCSVALAMRLQLVLRSCRPSLVRRSCWPSPVLLLVLLLLPALLSALLLTPVLLLALLLL